MVPHALSRHRLSSRPFAVAIMVLLGLAAASCHKMPLVAPSNSSITLVAATNVLPVNGSVEITAVVLQGSQTAGGGNNGGGTTTGTGTPVHNGTVVSFTTTLGRIEPADAETDNGKAVVRLIADGRSGKATVTAFSGAATKSVDVNVGAAGASRIAVTANPQTLPAAGGAAEISARVEDAQGNGVLGVPVSFSTDLGNLSAGTVLSNEQGFALTTLVTTQGPATVSASAGGATAALTGTVKITLKPRTVIEITAPASAQIGVGASFTFTPSANSFISDAVVNWGDGSAPTVLGALTAARVVGHLFEQTGNISVTASATGSDPTSTSVFVAPITISITAPSTGTVGKSISFSATVGPAAAAIDRVVWDFGDGTGAEGNSTAHAYTTPGAKVVRATAFPVVGPSRSTTATIIIE